jgi:hypothetical protein
MRMQHDADGRILLPCRMIPALDPPGWAGEDDLGHYATSIFGVAERGGRAVPALGRAATTGGAPNSLEVFPIVTLAVADGGSLRF